jgi:hypothetical protein
VLPELACASISTSNAQYAEADPEYKLTSVQLCVSPGTMLVAVHAPVMVLARVTVPVVKPLLSPVGRLPYSDRVDPIVTIINVQTATTPAATRNPRRPAAGRCSPEYANTRDGTGESGVTAAVAVRTAAVSRMSWSPRSARRVMPCLRK